MRQDGDFLDDRRVQSICAFPAVPRDSIPGYILGPRMRLFTQPLTGSHRIVKKIMDPSGAYGETPSFNYVAEISISLRSTSLKMSNINGSIICSLYYSIPRRWGGGVGVRVRLASLREHLKVNICNCHN